ncbi:DKNYY domain-containing protein [Bacteroides sedimenti]|uniref:DKNYY family protein n=1 Tax=Bacteroides sedimenti TaxID=2136147 RepID=A0ABN6ZA37_9BACE
MKKRKSLFKYMFFTCIILQLLGCEDYGEGYRIKKDGVYRYSWNPVVSSEPREWLIKGADPKTFQICDKSDCGKDKNHVYYKDNIIFDADPKTFESIDWLYGKDSKHVFYYEAYARSDSLISGIVSGANPDSFHKNKDDNYTDGKDVYYKNFPFHVYDIKTFVRVDHFGFVRKDKKYYYLISLSGLKDTAPMRYPLADYKTFHVLKEGNSVLESPYMADKEKVYYDSLVVEEADVKSFVALNYNYGKDRHRIYYNHKPLVKADFKTFRVDCLDSAHDAKHVYKRDRIVK